MKYILGTVQLGLDYGVNNAIGKPPREEAFAILSAAYCGGIRYLDTASGYGDSEKLIGEFIGKTGLSFDICSKYSGKGKLADELQATLKALSADKMFLYYLHRYEDYLDSSISESLARLKESGAVKYIGVSVYTPEELSFIAQDFKTPIDVVQIPFSILDCSRWIKALELANKYDIAIYCRSIFLQGAMFKPLTDKFIAAYGVEEQLAYLHDLCEKYSCDIGTLAFSFCECFNEISGVLFGAETLAQLNQNLVIIDNLIKINDSDIIVILEKMRNINPGFIDPRTW